MLIVDSHQHFWAPSELDLPPLPPEAALLDRAFLPSELQREMERIGVTHTVLVQAFPQDLSTNRWMLRLANTNEFVAGVVAWVDLQDPASVEPAMEDLAKEPKFVGIRHIVEAEPCVDWILQPSVLESLRELARFGVPYDMLVKPKHLRNVLAVLEKVPDLHVVIDHIAKPAIAEGGTPGWAEDLAAIAQCPTVYCKLSGMITEADWQNWTSVDLKPYVQHVIGIFGWDRVMFGSDWPVCLLAGDYGQVWNAAHEALGEVSAEQREKVFGANAIRFYSLDL